MGRRVKTTNQDQIDLSNISSGSYILQVTTQNNTTETLKSSNNEMNFTNIP
jgi:hypothetical protein